MGNILRDTAQPYLLCQGWTLSRHAHCRCAALQRERWVSLLARLRRSRRRRVNGSHLRSLSRRSYFACRVRAGEYSRHGRMVSQPALPSWVSGDPAAIFQVSQILTSGLEGSATRRGFACSGRIIRLSATSYPWLNSRLTNARLWIDLKASPTCSYVAFRSTSMRIWQSCFGNCCSRRAPRSAQATPTCSMEHEPSARTWTRTSVIGYGMSALQAASEILRTQFDNKVRRDGKPEVLSNTTDGTCSSDAAPWPARRRLRGEPSIGAERDAGDVAWT